MWKKGVWKKGRRKLTGYWRWNWAAQVFVIKIDGNDPVTGCRRQAIEVHGDNPNFGGWRLQEDGIQA